MRVSSCGFHRCGVCLPTGVGICLGLDLESGLDVFLRVGPYGSYVQLGESPAEGTGSANPRRAALKLKGFVRCWSLGTGTSWRTGLRPPSGALMERVSCRWGLMSLQWQDSRAVLLLPPYIYGGSMVVTPEAGMRTTTCPHRAPGLRVRVSDPHTSAPQPVRAVFSQQPRNLWGALGASLADPMPPLCTIPVVEALSPVMAN